MTDREPIETTNLDGYGNPALSWDRARGALVEGMPSIETAMFLGTVRPDGRPHSAGIGATWFDGDIYITSGPGTQKSRNLAANAAFTLSVRVPGMDLILNGSAARVTDRAVLEQVVEVFKAGGWPAEVDQHVPAFTAPFSAPSAGPPPWFLYRLTFDTVVAVASAEPYGATRWRFES